MAGEVLYRRWRSQTFGEVVGQEHVTRTLQNALASGRVAHAYLFSGPRGTGKTSTGRILAKALNCLENGRGEPCNQCNLCRAITEGRALDLIEIDAASNRGIDEIRDLREKVRFAPSEGRYKVYIIDEVHMLTPEAFNALLKTLEEPPPHTIFVLATTEPHRVPATVLSRCQRFDFRRIPMDAMLARLRHICQEEGILMGEEALRLLARSATGSLRDAENLLDQLVAYYGAEIDMPQVQNLLGITGDVRVGTLVRCLLSRDLAGGLGAIRSAADDGIDLRQFGREVVEYLRGMLLTKVEASLDLPSEVLEEMRSLASQANLETLVKAIRLFGQLDFRYSGQSSLPLELALLESALGEVEETMASIPQRKPTPAAAAEPTPQPIHEEPASPLPARPVAVSEGNVVAALSAQWKSVLEGLRATNKVIEALLRSSCEPVAVEDNTVVLGFYYPYHKEKVEDPRNRKVIEEVLSKVLGAPYRLRCVLTQRKRARPEGQADSHLVRAAMEMGARKITEDE